MSRRDYGKSANRGRGRRDVPTVATIAWRHAAVIREQQAESGGVVYHVYKDGKELSYGWSKSGAEAHAARCGGTVVAEQRARKDRP